MSYAERLRDPRWQRKRLEVMQRADFTCEHCGSKTRTLNVHHPRYVAGRDPWEYDATELRCLCEPCHKLEHDEAAKAAVEERKERHRQHEEQFAKDHPELAAIYARIGEIDSTLPGSDNDLRDALTIEKMELCDRIRELGGRRWKVFDPMWPRRND